MNANLAENYYNKTEIDTKVRELNDAIGGIDSLKNLKVDYDNTTGRLVFKDGRLSCGRATARKIGEQAGAKIVIGRRVLYSIEKVKKYLLYLEE